MITEEELRDALTTAVDGPAAEAYTLGLSDRALALSQGRERKQWARFAPGIAVGTAFVVAGAFGVAALGGGMGGGAGGRVTASNVPATAPNRTSPVALLDFEVECPGGGGPKMAMDWVFDPATQQYQGVDSSVYTTYTPSPDGKQTLVVQGVDTALWGVAGWQDAVAMRLTLHEKHDMKALHWTADSKELTTTGTFPSFPDKDGSTAPPDTAAEFYDPNTGEKYSVPFPQTVLDAVSGGKWRLLQWQGDHDSVVFPMVDAAGDQLQWVDARGRIVRHVALKDGMPAATMNDGSKYLGAFLSPDGRYLAETDSWSVATFDLADGRRLGEVRIPVGNLVRNDTGVWSGDHQIIFTIDEKHPDPAKPDAKESKTGHSPIYRVLGPDLKVIEESRFVLPADPKGYCSTWPITWAPRSQFPGAFVP